MWVILFSAKSKNIRNLINLNDFIDDEKTYDINNFRILGQLIRFKEKISYKDKKISHKIIIETNSGSATFGSDNLNLDYHTEKSVFQILPFMKIGIPEAPDVILTLKGVANIKHLIEYDYCYEDKEYKIEVYIYTTIYANVEYDFGGNFNSIAASAKGTIISFESHTTLRKGNELFEKRKINRASGGAVTIHLTGKTVDNETFSYDHELWSGWSN